MNTQELIAELEVLEVCGEAMQWVQQNKHLTPRELWDTCPRGDWMLWFAGVKGVDQVKLASVACAYAETVVHLVPDESCQRALEAAKACLIGEATVKDAEKAAAAVADTSTLAAAYAEVGSAWTGYTVHAAVSHAAYAAALATSLSHVADLADAARPACTAAVVATAAFVAFAASTRVTASSHVGAAIEYVFNAAVSVVELSDKDKEKHRMYKQCADIVRRTIKFEDVLEKRKVGR